MNSPRFVTLSRLITAVGFVIASAAVQAGGNNVYWSVNVDAPMQGAGRVSTSFSNTRHGMYGYGQPAPVVYAPAPVIIQAPGQVYYREPGRDHRDYRHHARHHHHHHRLEARMARVHQRMANFHAARAEAWSGGRRDGGRYGRDEGRGGYYDY